MVKPTPEYGWAVFQYYRHIAILEHAISILQTFPHFNNITCAIYRRILPNNAYCYCSICSYSVLVKFVPTTGYTIESYK